MAAKELFPANLATHSSLLLPVGRTGVAGFDANVTASELLAAGLSTFHPARRRLVTTDSHLVLATSVADKHRHMAADLLRDGCQVARDKPADGMATWQGFWDGHRDSAIAARFTTNLAAGVLSLFAEAGASLHAKEPFMISIDFRVAHRTAGVATRHALAASAGTATVLHMLEVGQRAGVNHGIGVLAADKGKARDQL